MDPDEHRTALRIAVNSSDGVAVVAVLTGRFWPDHALEMIGDGLLTALDQQVRGAPELATECIERLQERRWEGDGELADQLAARLGSAATPLLRPLSVSLEELASVLEGDPLDSGGRVDLQTGEVWSVAAIDYAREEGEEDEDASEDPDRWLWVDGLGSRPGYQDMEDFIDTVGDPQRADRLGIAIHGRGAFRRFKDVLGRWPDELARWYAFSEDRQRGRARAWLADAGYRATGA